MGQLNTLTIAKIKQWEGLRLAAYQDSAGVWTIGYGHTGGVFPGMRISNKEASTFLLEDLEEAIRAVESLVRVELTDNQFGALVSFVFNLGVGAFRKSTLLRELNKGNYERVPTELARFNKIRVGGVYRVDKGLVNRRSAEIGLWASGSFVAGTNVIPANPVSYKTDAVKYGVSMSGVGTAGQVLTDSANQLSYVSEYSTTLRFIFVTLMLLGVGLTTYFLIRSHQSD